MYICRALLKHGYSNGTFSLSILEYCEPEKCLEREDYYLKLLKPEYNTSLDPTAPFSGLTHSDESRKKISDSKIGSKHSDETRKKISDAQKKIDNSGRFKTGQSKAVGAGKPSQQIEVFDLQEKTTTSYNSISEATRVLGFPSHISIQYSLNTGKAYKKRYIFKKL
jgi:group I intron endonuclease